MNNRRSFIKKSAIASAGLLLANATLFSRATSYKRILGANERIYVGLAGLGRRYGAFIEPIAKTNNQIHLSYLCDVMDKQISNALKSVQAPLGYAPAQIKDYRKMIEDKNLDAVFIATPDHWHAPGSIMAMQSGKHVYVEKPCSHNMEENELLVDFQKRTGMVVQMGNQQRSSGHTIRIIQQIHNGLIGTPYKAVAFYNNNRGAVPHQKPAPIPAGLDWDLFQGPAPRKAYTDNTWDYNWHWYGWDFGTAEAGNNGTHELDVARWALQVDFPLSVRVDAGKYHFLDDGWTMYDTMLAEFKFDGNKTIQWDGKSRNGLFTYGSDRGVLIYGSEGSMFVNREKYIVYDRSGKMIEESTQKSNEAGNALGGGGDMTTLHVENFFDAIRGKAALNAPIRDASVSMAMVHYSNIAYRIGQSFKITKDGKMQNPEAMELWTREYEPGWQLK
jgi:predicted dehydrogenase